MPAHRKEKCELSYQDNLEQLGMKGVAGVVNGVGVPQDGTDHADYNYLFGR